MRQVWLCSAPLGKLFVAHEVKLGSKAFQSNCERALDLNPNYISVGKKALREPGKNCEKTGGSDRFRTHQVRAADYFYPRNNSKFGKPPTHRPPHARILLQ